MKNFGLKKDERIHLREELQYLFKTAEVIHLYPFRVLHCTYSSKEENFNVLKMGVSAPKKRFKKAVDRNLLKRRIREAYRLNRNELKLSLNNNKGTLLLLFIYIGKEAESYAIIEEKIILILQKLQSIYAQTNQ